MPKNALQRSLAWPSQYAEVFFIQTESKLHKKEHKPKWTHITDVMDTIAPLQSQHQAGSLVSSQHRFTLSHTKKSHVSKSGTQNSIGLARVSQVEINESFGNIQLKKLEVWALWQPKDDRIPGQSQGCMLHEDTSFMHTQLSCSAPAQVLFQKRPDASANRLQTCQRHCT